MLNYGEDLQNLHVQRSPWGQGLLSMLHRSLPSVILAFDIIPRVCNALEVYFNL